MKELKVALVCDWLTNVGGAEKVLLQIHKMYPDAPIFTSKYNPRKIDWFLDADVRTGWLQIFPTCLRRFLGVFRQHYFEHLDLSEYDLVISVTGAEAKSVKAPNGLHVSYCHVPTQYYWQMYDQYVENPGFGILDPMVRFFFKKLVKPLRKADFKAAQKVDQFVTISEYAKEQIKKYYKRDAVIVYPPVEVDDFKNGSKEAGDYYITTSRQVTWKKLDLAVKACLEVERPLVVVGEGPEHKKLVKLAGGSDLIKFLPLQKKPELAKLLAGAKGYLFPSLEPFGIAPIEALAAGCPVIAFGQGGAVDYVKDGENGVLFEKQTATSLGNAIVRFEGMKLAKNEIVKSAEKFKTARFNTELAVVIKESFDVKCKD